MEKELVKKLESIHNLPTLPTVINRLRRSINNPKSDATVIGAIIQDDPAMMARILKIVNSVFYGGVEPITSVNQAVARMGFSAISNIALSTFVFSSFDSAENTAFDRTAFWRHSISTGVAADVIYQRTKQNIPFRFTQDVLHLTGLLHDIGKIVFEQYFHEQFMEAVKKSRKERVALYKCEQDAIGADHAEVGAWLAEKWRILPPVVEAIRHHHAPEHTPAEHRPLVMLCNIANYICNVEHIGESGDSAAPEHSHSSLLALNLSTEALHSLTAAINEETEKSNLLLSIMK